MEVGTILFFVFAFLALVGAIGLVTNRSPINTVLLVVLNFFAIGGLYLTLAAEFLAVVQIIVYAGAIMVLFLFVVMLLNLNKEDMERVKLDKRRGLAFILGLGFLAMLLYALMEGVSARPLPELQPYAYGKVEPIGRLLMTDYLFPFEMISVILLSALMGAVVIAKKHN
jgi:NADH-quinone oxidoreductase subunit J